MNLKTLLALTLGVVMVTRIEAKPSQSPLQIRMSLDQVRKTVSWRDQEVLRIMENLAVDSKKGGDFAGVTAAIIPNKAITP